MHSQHTEAEHMALGESPDTQKSIGNGYLGFLRQFFEFAVSFRNNYTSTGDDDWPLGLVDQFSSLLDLQRMFSSFAGFSGYSYGNI